MSDLNSALNNLSNYFESQYKDLQIEFLPYVQGLSIIIKKKGAPYSFLSVTLNNNLGYIDMYQIDSQGRGYGILLMVAMIDILKKLGCKTLSGHVTNINVLKILERLCGKSKMKFYTRSLFGQGRSMTYQEAVEIANSVGFIIFVDI
jgi:hypothetical protein